MVKKIIVKKIISDENIKNKEGEYFPESFYNKKDRYIIDYDCDVYTNSGKLLLKFRKNVIPPKYTDIALKAYLEASKKKHENRGAAAGELDRNKLANYIGTFVNKSKFRTGFYSSVSGKKSKQATSNLSKSNIIGFFDVPDRNLKGKGAPCRLTAFNRDNPELWKTGLPFIKKCNEQFKKLIPTNYKIQYDRAQQTPNFVIPGTAFSTITINYSWRTALHQDKGDLKEGFGNLIVIEDPNNKNTYNGSYIGFPQYGVCVDVRTGDFLAMDVHEWHCNTEFKKKTNKIFKDGFKDIDIKNNWHFNRLSMVMYLREKMIKCKNKSLWKNKLGGGKKNKQKDKHKYKNSNNKYKQKDKNIYNNENIETKILKYLPHEYIDYMNYHYGLFNDIKVNL